MRRSARLLLLLAIPTLSSCARYVSTHAERGDHYFNQRKFREAIGEYVKASRFAPNDPRIIRQLGLANYLVSEYTDAYNYLIHAEELDPQNAQIRIVLGNIEVADRRPDDALKEANAVLALQPRNVGALSIMGSAYRAKSEPAKAVEAYKEMSDLVPTAPDGPFLMAQSLLSLGDRAAAVRQLEIALARDPAHLGALTSLVQLDLVEHRADAALQRVERRIAATGGSPRDSSSIVKRVYGARLFDLLGMVRASRNEFDPAEAAFREAMGLDSTLSDTRIHLAELLARTGKSHQAVVELQAAARMDSTSPRAYLMLGLVSQQANDFPKATQAYERALALDPRSAVAANNLAWLLAEKRGDVRRAIDVAKTAYTLAPKDPHIADTYGWILYRAGAANDATPVLKAAAANLTEDGQVQYHLGMALLSGNDAAGARRALESAVNSPTNFADKEVARRALASLK